jgi:hypothetical protein
LAGAAVTSVVDGLRDALGLPVGGLARAAGLTGDAPRCPKITVTLLIQVNRDSWATGIVDPENWTTD